MKDDRLYLLHISDCIERVEQYTAAGQHAFEHDTKTQDAVLRNLQVLAESSQRVSAELKQAHPEVPWRTLAAFRNVLVHAYLGINLGRIWEIVSSDLPALKDQLSGISKLARGEPNGEGVS